MKMFWPDRGGLSGAVAPAVMWPTAPAECIVTLHPKSAKGYS